jgi:integrase
MRGSVRELRPGYCQLRVYVGRDPVTSKDRYRTKCVTATTKKKAEGHLPQFIVDLQTEPGVTTNGTVGHLLDQVIAHLRDRDREATTLRGYQGIAKQVKETFGDLPLPQLTPQHVNSYYTTMRKRGASPGTIGNHHRFLRRAFNLAIRWGWAHDNVVNRADPPPAHKKNVVAPTNAVVAKLIDAARQETNRELWVAFTLAAALGCRRGELCGLRWSDIDLDTGHVVIRRAVKQLTRGAITAISDTDTIVARTCIVGDVKTHQTRRLTVGGGVLVVLNGHHAKMQQRAARTSALLSPDAYVLSDAADGTVPWRPDRLTLSFIRLRTKIGAPTLRLHDLRHWNTSELLDKHEDVTVIAERGGWRDKATLHNTYGHMLPSGDQRAAQIIDEALFGKDELRKRRRRKQA